MFWKNRFPVETPIETQGDAVKPVDRSKTRVLVPADPARAELTSLAGSEEVNYLVLNIADEIVNGKRTVGDAKAFRARILRLLDSGKSSPYLLGLLFAAHGPAYGLWVYP